MHFNRHSGYEDRHALLSASKYHWLRYDAEKLAAFYKSQQAAIIGTKVHDFAKGCIECGITLPHKKKTLNMFVNDSIKWGMTPEVTLYYSEFCFGKTDAIGFNEFILRISDLKTGVTRTSFDQLLIYAALFCLEYEVSPFDIKRFELRIYQNDAIKLLKPKNEDVYVIMNRIIEADEQLNLIRKEEGLFDVYEP